MFPEVLYPFRSSLLTHRFPEEAGAVIDHHVRLFVGPAREGSSSKKSTEMKRGEEEGKVKIPNVSQYYLRSIRKGSAQEIQRCSR